MIETARIFLMLLLVIVIALCLEPGTLEDMRIAISVADSIYVSAVDSLWLLDTLYFGPVIIDTAIIYRVIKRSYYINDSLIAMDSLYYKEYTIDPCTTYYFVDSTWLAKRVATSPYLEPIQ